MSSVLRVSVTVCSGVNVGFATGISIVGCSTSVSVAAVYGGALMMSINRLSCLSGSIWRPLVVALIILPCTPMNDSLVVGFLPRNLSWCGIMYCTVSPCRVLFVPPPKVGSLAIIVDCKPIE